MSVNLMRAILLLAFAAPLHAQDDDGPGRRGVDFGMGGGYKSVNGAESVDTWSMRMMAGYRHNPNWSLELSADFGTKNQERADGQPYNISPGNFGLAVVYSLPLHGSFSGFAKVGATRWRLTTIDHTAAGIPIWDTHVEHDGTSPVFGVGVKWRSGPRTGFRLGYETFRAEDVRPFGFGMRDELVSLSFILSI